MLVKGAPEVHVFKLNQLIELRPNGPNLLIKENNTCVIYN